MSLIVISQDVVVYQLFKTTVMHIDIQDHQGFELVTLNWSPKVQTRERK